MARCADAECLEFGLEVDFERSNVFYRNKSRRYVHRRESAIYHEHNDRPDSLTLNRTAIAFLGSCVLILPLILLLFVQHRPNDNRFVSLDPMTMLSTLIKMLVFTMLLLGLTFVNVDASTPFVGGPLLTQVDYTADKLWRAATVQSVESYNSGIFGTIFNGNFTGLIKCNRSSDGEQNGGHLGCVNFRVSLSHRVFANLQFVPKIRLAPSALGENVNYYVQIYEGVEWPLNNDFSVRGIDNQFGPLQYSDVDSRIHWSERKVTSEPQSIVYQWLGQSLITSDAQNRNILGGPTKLAFNVCVFSDSKKIGGCDAIIDEIEVRAHLNMNPRCTYNDNVELLTQLVKPRNQTVCHSIGDGTYKMLPSLDPAALSNRHLDIYGGHLNDVLAGNALATCTANDATCTVLDCFCQPACKFETERDGLAQPECYQLDGPLLCDGVLETELNMFGDISCCDSRCEICGGSGCAARGAAIGAQCCSNPILRLGRTCRQTNGLPPCISNGDPDCKDGTLLSNKACCPIFCRDDKAWLTLQAEGGPVNPDGLSVVNGCYIGRKSREEIGFGFTDDILDSNKTCSQHVAPCFVDAVRRDDAGVSFWDE
jgi:hypothetical protein